MGLFDELEAEYESEVGESTPADDSLDAAYDQPLVEGPTDDDLERVRVYDRKIAKAAYYRVIFQNGVVEDNGTPEAREVNREARIWAGRQMGILIEGKDPEAPASTVQFSDEEVAVLRRLIAKVQAGVTAATPLVPAAPAAIATKAPALPTVRTITQPAPAKKQVQTPKPAPQVPPKPKNKPKPKAPPKAAGDSGKFFKGELPMTTNEQGVPVVDVDMIDVGLIFKKDGRFFKVVEKPDGGGHGMISVDRSPRPRGVRTPQTNEEIQAAMMTASHQALQTREAVTGQNLIHAVAKAFGGDGNQDEE